MKAIWQKFLKERSDKWAKEALWADQLEANRPLRERVAELEKELEEDHCNHDVPGRDRDGPGRDRDSP